LNAYQWLIRATAQDDRWSCITADDFITLIITAVMKKIFIFCVCAVICGLSIKVQGQANGYVKPKDPQVQQKLAWWQDQKFGLLMHWGAYSQWGVVESWSICPEDEPWTQRHGHGSDNYFTYLKNYEDLPETFNPVEFNPDKWAAAAKNAGMRYVVFTTKHHDGFCMFDTHQTDYKITGPACPFHSNPKANVTREIFSAFRKDGFGIGAYFSKPDWHSPYFWWPYFPPLDRFPNYDEAKYPGRWQKFKDYTFNQIKELLGGEYGKVDILWLDGGWVRPHTAAEIEAHPRRNDEVDMGRIAKMARQLQPGILMVDRSVGGIYENYRTPEQQVPDHVLPYPWETCMTMGNSWSYVPHDTYKPAGQLIGLLVKIVAYGGNFLLNIGPDGKGDWDPVAYQRLKEIGAWMKVNSEGIYGTHPLAPYHEGRMYFTQKKSDGACYAFYVPDTSMRALPAQITISTLRATAGSKVYLLGYPRPLKWKKNGDGMTVLIPRALQKDPPCRYAWALKFQG
jgi:alpha-L-fucosidase